MHFRPAADPDPFRNQAATPEIAASIASCTQRIVTIAKRPSAGTERRIYTVNQNSGKAKYFCAKDLTGYVNQNRFRTPDRAPSNAMMKKIKDSKCELIVARDDQA